MTTNIKEVNEFIQQLLDACRDYRKQLDDKNEEITRLRSIIERAMGPCSWKEYDKQHPERLPSDLQGMTMEDWYNGFTKIEKTEDK